MPQKCLIFRIEKVFALRADSLPSTHPTDNFQHLSSNKPVTRNRKAATVTRERVYDSKDSIEARRQSGGFFKRVTFISSKKVSLTKQGSRFIQRNIVHRNIAQL